MRRQTKPKQRVCTFSEGQMLNRFDRHRHCHDDVQHPRGCNSLTNRAIGTVMWLKRRRLLWACRITQILIRTAGMRVATMGVHIPVIVQRAG